jgi:diaminopimelate epimerase
MLIPFTKMHGTGNDFVVFDAIRHNVALTPEKIRHIADRHFGVGCDQVLVVERPTKPEADFRYRIYNADGGEVEQCGNGARCFARFVHERGLTDKREIVVETIGGIIRPRLESDGHVAVNMGTPRFEPREVPFEAPARAAHYPIEINGRTLELSVLSMGNPHAVQIVADVESAPVATDGPSIERHPRFPRRVNAGFMQIVDRGNVRLRVFERGAGETLACGTGACAAVVAGRHRGLLDATVEVRLPGGTLRITWAGEGEPVWMAGPAETVYEGIIDLEAL